MEWVSLSTSFSRENITECAEEMKTILPNFSINEESLFDDYSHVKIHATESKITEWNNASYKIRDRWKEIFAHFKKEQITYNEIELLSFCLTTPGSNASVERIFSLMNSLWTD
jgi:hypothetical protein